MRVGDGATTEAGNSIRDELSALVDAKQVTEKGHKGKYKDQQSDPDKADGNKRKADELECAPDAEEDPRTSKRQLLGLDFISTAFKVHTFHYFNFELLVVVETTSTWAHSKFFPLLSPSADSESIEEYLKVHKMGSW